MVRRNQSQGKNARRRRSHFTVKSLGFELLEPRRLLAVNVVTFHNDLTRQGLNNQEAALNGSNVNSSAFGKLYSYSVQGQIYAEPLYVSNLAIPGQGIRNVVFVATENNDVYAFDGLSNSGPNGGLLWHINLGPAAATPPPNNYFGSRYGPYSDIKPQVGITSTPVIDLATNTMYIDAFTNDVVGQNEYSHHIWAIDITTGQQRVAPMLVAASVQGNGAGSVGGVITFKASQQIQRSALTLLNGVVYVAYAGFADTDPYTGWILGFDASNLQVVKVLNTAPNAGADTHEGEAGIWGGGGGLVSDGVHLYAMTGNGDFQPSIGDYGDSFLEITPDNSTQAGGNLNGYGLSITDYFTPFNEQSLANNDTDLGSGAPILLPTQGGAHPNELVGAGKQGVIYLLDRDNMGHFNAATDNVVQKVSLSHGTFSTPAYFNNTIYYHANGSEVLKAFSIVNGIMSSAPIAQGATGYPFPGASPSVSAAGTANGIVWDVQYIAAHAILRAYDAVSLVELYNSSQNIARDQLGPGVKFVTPMIADGHVFVGTDGALAVYGLLAPPTTLPTAPTGLAASNATALQIKLTWLDNATNEGSYIIERSTDGVNFTQIANANVNATSYTDTSVLPEVKYYYRVRSTNTVGNSAAAGPVNSTVVAVATPVLLYHFDEGTGLTTADSAGTNTGTLVGTVKPTWSSGRVGTGALTFTGDGVTNSIMAQSAVQTLNSLAGTLGGTATLTAWIKTTQAGNNTPTSAPAITGVDTASSTNDIRWGYLDATGHIGIGAGATSFVSTSPINDGTWHHVALTRNSTTGLVQIYIDGVFQKSGTSETGTKSTAFRLIGAQSAVASDGVTSLGATFLNGMLDDVRTYGRVLTAAEIAAIGQIPSPPNNLVASPLSGTIVKLTWANISGFQENIEVQRKIGINGTYTPIALVAGNATNYVDTDLEPGTDYYYLIRSSTLAGYSAYSNQATATPPRPEVVNRMIFYNQSSFDGQNGSSNIADGLAIATDKQALLPGQTATFQNYTSYSSGINGIGIDVSNFDVPIDESNFILLVGNSSDPNSWQPAPEPSFISVYPGWGNGGSTRIELGWDNGEIKNEWLQVTFKADSITNLAAPDVFYFGNAVGESGNSPTSAAVDTADELGARSHATGLGSAAIDNVYDYNRDKHVDTQDELIARANRSGLSPLQLIAAPSLAAGASTVDLASAATATVILAESAPALAPEPVATVSSVVSPIAPLRPALLDAVMPGAFAASEKPSTPHNLVRPQFTADRQEIDAALTLFAGTLHRAKSVGLQAIESHIARAVNGATPDALAYNDEHLLATDEAFRGELADPVANAAHVVAVSKHSHRRGS